MKWGTLVVLAGCCAIAGASSAEETRQERGKRVVYEALRALGGDAFQHVESRVESGRAYSFYREQLQGLSLAKIYTRYVPPEAGRIGIREREAFGKDESNSVLFREDGAWEITFRGARPLDDQRYANFKDSTRRNIFYMLRYRLNEPGLTFYSQGTKFFENRPVELVEIMDAENLAVTVYFDQSTKLPVRQVFKRRNPEYKDFDEETSVFAKYRDVGGGVKWPFSLLRERNGQKIFEMYSDSVEINRSLPDTLFTLPADITILPKPKK